MVMSSDGSADGLTYRERDVDDTLDDHESRISRLEKVALVGVGYGLASGANIVTDFMTLL
jgi:hypothetical protein